MYVGRHHGIPSHVVTSTYGYMTKTNKENQYNIDLAEFYYDLLSYDYNDRDGVKADAEDFEHRLELCLYFASLITNDPISKGIVKYNYKIVVEVPRELRTRYSNDVTVDTFTSFVYNRKNKESALKSFGSVANLQNLRSQGFKLSRTEFKKYRNMFVIERV